MGVCVLCSFCVVCVELCGVVWGCVGLCGVVWSWAELCVLLCSCVCVVLCCVVVWHLLIYFKKSVCLASTDDYVNWNVFYYGNPLSILFLFIFFLESFLFVFFLNSF
jgi:hypothetical protein